jgi:DNA-binding GntR family transcriptional regulator
VKAARLEIEPLTLNFSLKDRVYDALRKAITEMELYATREPIRLDERQLAADLGVSRTPIREALHRLEQEGFVRVAQRRGVFVVRKTKAELLEMIRVWAALESMAARLITEHASAAEIATLRTLFATFENDPASGQSQVRARIDEYSDTNLRFHQRLLELSGSALIVQLTGNLLPHMRSIRRKTISDGDRPERSIIDHMHIIEALERRDTELAERLTRQHTLELAAHVERHVTTLD